MFEISLNDNDEDNDDEDNNENISPLKQNNIYSIKSKEQNEKIRDLTNKLHNTEKKLQNLLSRSRRIINPNINLVDIIKNEKFINRTVKYKCMWDHHTFDTIPFFLPFKYINGVYHVYGSFSSPECAMAYNNNIMTDGDQNKKERNSLINLMVEEMTGKYDSIKPAPSPEIINCYPYGHLTIEEYRNNLSMGIKEFIQYLPPMIPILPKIEEDYINKGPKGSYKLTSKYKLQRSKPLPQEQNSIIAVMGIKFKDKK